MRPREEQYDSLHVRLMDAYLLGNKYQGSLDMEAFIQARGLPQDSNRMTEYQYDRYFSDPVWSDLLKDHFDYGMTVDELSDLYEMTRPTVYYHLKRLGVTPNRNSAPALSEGDRLVVMDLLEAGVSKAEIARQTGASYEQIRYIADTMEGTPV